MWSQGKERFDGNSDVTTDAGVGHLRMRQAHLARISEHGCVDLVFGAKHHFNKAQGRAQRDAKGSGVVPLIGAKINIQHDWHSCLLCHLGGKKGRAAARFLAQSCATDQESTALGNRGRQDIVNSQFDISAVVAIVG